MWLISALCDFASLHRYDGATQPENGVQTKCVRNAPAAVADWPNARSQYGEQLRAVEAAPGSGDSKVRRLQNEVESGLDCHYFACRRYGRAISDYQLICKQNSQITLLARNGINSPSLDTF